MLVFDSLKTALCKCLKYILSVTGHLKVGSNFDDILPLSIDINYYGWVIEFCFCFSRDLV